MKQVDAISNEDDLDAAQAEMGLLLNTDLSPAQEARLDVLTELIYVYESVHWALSKPVLNYKIDWSECPLVRRTVMLGWRWRVKGTRILVECLIKNYNAGHTTAHLMKRFPNLKEGTVTEILMYAAMKLQSAL